MVPAFLLVRRVLTVYPSLPSRPEVEVRLLVIDTQLAHEWVGCVKHLAVAEVAIRV